MSIELTNSEPRGITVKTGFQSPLIVNIYSSTTNLHIELNDFINLIKYVLTNTDLEDKDPRIKCLEDLKQYSIVEGWNSKNEPNCKRIKVPGEM